MQYQYDVNINHSTTEGIVVQKVTVYANNEEEALDMVNEAFAEGHYDIARRNDLIGVPRFSI